MIQSKRYRNFIIILIAILVTDIAIFMNLPILRQVLAFGCFTILPGFLILYLLKLDEINLVKKFVLSVGLSISFLIFGGLFVNTLGPVIGISKPLSTLSLSIAFSIAMVALGMIGFKRTARESDFRFFDLKSLDMDKLKSPLIFAILLPVLSVIGIFLMNMKDDNRILLMLLILILIYVAVVAFNNKRIPKATYPIAIFMISLSLVLIAPLRGEHMILGADSSVEYHFLYITAINSYWDIGYSNGVNACLSVGLLHTIYIALMDISPEWCYKIISPLLISITPLAIFLLSKKYVGDLYGFLSAVFFMVAWGNFANAINAVRIVIGVFFLALTMMALFEDEISEMNRRIIFLIFMLSLIVSYYTYTYEFFILIALGLTFSIIINIKDRDRSKKRLTPMIVTLAAVAIFFWYSQVASTSFDNLVTFVEVSIRSQAQAFVLESRAEVGQKAFGRGLVGVPEILNFIIYYVTLAIVAIGGVDLIRRYKTSKFGMEYTSMVLACLVIWVVIIITPYASQGFGIERGYYPTLIILAPCLIIGAKLISRTLHSKRWGNSASFTGGHPDKFAMLIVIAVIASQLMVNTGITYQIFGNPRSVFLNSEGLHYDCWYVHIQEVEAAKWLSDFTENDISVHLSFYMYKNFVTLQEDRINIKNTFFKINKSVSEGYIYLGYQNIVDKTTTPFLFRKTSLHHVPLGSYSHLFAGKSKIYANGGSEIWN